MMKGEKHYKTFVMFSATMIPQVEKLARKYLKSPAYISVGQPGGGKKDIEQHVQFVSEGQKRHKLT
jgi:ATP-dependent RNA helicase DDX23/PRP28